MVFLEWAGDVFEEGEDEDDGLAFHRSMLLRSVSVAEPEFGREAEVGGGIFAVGFGAGHRSDVVNQ